MIFLPSAPRCARLAAISIVLSPHRTRQAAFRTTADLHRRLVKAWECSTTFSALELRCAQIVYLSIGRLVGRPVETNNANVAKLAAEGELQLKGRAVSH